MIEQKCGVGRIYYVSCFTLDLTGRPWWLLLIDAHSHFFTAIMSAFPSTSTPHFTDSVDEIGKSVQTRLYSSQLACVDLGPCRETYCTPMGTSLACSEQCGHQDTSRIFCAAMSAMFSLSFRMAPSCSSIPSRRTSVRSLTLATVPLGSSITCHKASARSFRSTFGLLRPPRMYSAMAPCR